MTFQEFLNKYDRKPIDDDGYYGQQCMDVYNRFQREVLGLSPVGAPSAKDVWNNYPQDRFTRIPNTPSGVPQKGDVIIWGTGVGQYGHIAIFISGDINQFTSFDQNWPFDNGNGVAHFQWHNYNGVLGWLRPKKDVNFDQAAFNVAEKARKDAEEVARKAKEETDRKAAEKITKKAKEEADRLATEKAKAEKEAQEKAAAEKVEAERIAEEQRKLEEELKAKQEAEKKGEAMFKGKRTYMTIGLMLVVGLGAAFKVLPISPELASVIDTVLGFLAMYFRSQA